MKPQKLIIREKVNGYNGLLIVPYAGGLFLLGMALVLLFTPGDPAITPLGQRFLGFVLGLMILFLVAFEGYLLIEIYTKPSTKTIEREIEVVKR